MSPLPICVTCAIILSEGKILLTQRSEKMRHPLLWEFPGGKVEEGEDEATCLIREIQEELSILIQIKKQLVPVDYSYSSFTIRLIPFVCNWMEGTLLLKEHKTFAWASPEEIPAYLLTDADRELIRINNLSKLFQS